MSTQIPVYFILNFIMNFTIISTTESAMSEGTDMKSASAPGIGESPVIGAVGDPLQFNTAVLGTVLCT
jgi:hypothetical protein